MSSYDYSNTMPQINFKYTLTFKVSYEQHTLVLEMASQSGQNIAATCRELIELGLAAHNSKEVIESEKPKVKVLHELRKARERQNMMTALAELKGELSEVEFQRHCGSLGIDPEAVEELAPQRGGHKKEDRCISFLRVLFIDRPDGLPANLVLEIAAQEGFGKNTTYKAAAKVGIKFVVGSILEGRASIWKLVDSE